MPTIPIDVLRVAGEDEHLDGWVLPGRIKPEVPDEARSFAPYTIRVVRVNDAKIAKDMKEALKPRQWARMLGYFQIRRAINRGDLFTAANVARDVAKRIGAPRAADISHYNLRSIITREQNEHLKRARLVIWAHAAGKVRIFDLGKGATQRSKLSLDLGVLCDASLTAFFVYEALGRVRACPCCGNVFRPTRPDQDYCSDRCRDTFNKRKTRAKMRIAQAEAANRSRSDSK